MSYFYSHIIEIESVISALDELNLKDDHKSHLASLIDSTIHQTILDVILSKLSSDDKKAFLWRLRENPQDKKLLEFLNDKIDNVEEEIRQAVKEVKKELHKDIKQAQRIKRGGK